MSRVSVLVPARNERFLAPTIADLLSKARGDIEVIAVLDGYWPDPALPSDSRLKLLHFGSPRGMRPAINAAVQMSTGSYLLKCDAHTMWDEGFDLKLKADYHEDNWILVPRRYALDPDAWAIDSSNPKYPVDYHYLSYPFERLDDPTCGLHGTEWRSRREARADLLLDDEMSSQGSGWFMSRAHWERLGPLDSVNYGNFIQEFQELGLSTWLGGGAVKVTKRTWYAHLYKGKKYGRGYSMVDTNHQAGAAFCIDYWMHDQWSNRVRDLRWLVEKFSPVPTWPVDLDEAFRDRRGLAAARFARSARDGRRVA
jgi:glycosyltransferase involved in cell wall biosynthesis